MKIAQIAPLIERVPPKKYGGTERMIYALTEELVKRGHDVTLFASGDSQTSAKLVSAYPRALREAKVKDPYGLNPWTILNIGLPYSHQDEYDIIHDHNEQLSIATAHLATTPTLFTLHREITPEMRKVYETFRKPCLVTISKAQIVTPGKLNIVGNVSNGLNFEGYEFSGKSENYLLFVGRISMEKGVHFAIEAALALDLPLIIAAKLEPYDIPYFKSYVEPYLGGNIQWIGEVDQIERNKLMSKALCLLHPVIFREPFGLTLIEALACGCPVIAFDRGSIPEIIWDGKVGFVVSDLEEMLDSILQIGNIDRHACQKYALENFSAEKMAEGYEQIYKKILTQTN